MKKIEVGWRVEIRSRCQFPKVKVSPGVLGRMVWLLLLLTVKAEMLIHVGTTGKHPRVLFDSIDGAE